MRHFYLTTVCFLFCFSLLAQIKQDSTYSFAKFDGLPLKATRLIDFNTNEGSWISLDVSPDGKTIAFDLMGDIYTIPITGGDATAITRGIALDIKPRFSPDGKKLLFISDRSGADNVWYIDFEKKDTIQLTRDPNLNHFSAVWSRDGKYIVTSKGKMLPQLHIVNIDGGGGMPIPKQTIKYIDPFFSADGKWIYSSVRARPWDYNAAFPQYQIAAYNFEKDEWKPIASKYGSAMSPTLSNDGKWMVYASRYETETGLILRNLITHEEKWLAYPVQRDDQESIANLGTMPSMAFTPDNQYLVASYGGKIYKINISNGTSTEIPFNVNVKLEVAPALDFKYTVKDSSHALITQIRNPVRSPNGKQLAFTAKNRLYVMDYPNGTPRRLTTHEFSEAQPVWTNDGQHVIFTTWNGNEGHLYKAAVNGKINVQRLTKENAVYVFPGYDFNNNRIVTLKFPSTDYKNAFDASFDGGRGKIVWLTMDGEENLVVDNVQYIKPHFVEGVKDRIYFTGAGGLYSMRYDGTDVKTHLKVTGKPVSGIMNFEDEHSSNLIFESVFSEKAGMGMEVNTVSTASEVMISPKGDYAIASILNDIYYLEIPMLKNTVNIHFLANGSTAFPSKKITKIGGEFAEWSRDGREINWSIGNGYFSYHLDSAKRFDDSVKLAKKLEKEKKLQDTAAKKDSLVTKDSTLNKDSAKVDSIKKDSVKVAPKTAYTPVETEIKIYYKKDIPTGNVLLQGARLVTMKGDEIIEEGDILIENNRIKAVGPTGSLSVPRGTKVMNVKGKTILPGFVDTHAHMWPFRELFKNQVWMYSINLAYGVTTTRDPQTGSSDVLTYSDMVEAGDIIGPRIYSTGQGVGYWMYDIQDSAEASNVLQQYSKYYNTKYIKMYLTGPRKVRQWIIDASRQQKLLPTTEGGLNMKLNITNLLDGYPGHEHSFPINPLYKDFTYTVSQMKMAYTPTLLVSYGGPWAEEYYYSTENVFGDSKLRKFTPYEELALKSRRRKFWAMKEEHVFYKHAKTANEILKNGGLLGIGSHGQLQGLGYHWELWSVQSGGMNNHDALRVATILGAQSLGLDGDLGSLEVGKLADLIILDKNPLENIRNSNTVYQVMKNGRLYDGNTLDQVYPANVKYKDPEDHSQTPTRNTSLK